MVLMSAAVHGESLDALVAACVEQQYESGSPDTTMG